MREFSDQQRADLVSVLSALEAAERYMRAVTTLTPPATWPPGYGPRR
jgi:hypothetical protein